MNLKNFVNFFGTKQGLAYVGKLENLKKKRCAAPNGHWKQKKKAQ